MIKKIKDNKKVVIILSILIIFIVLIRFFISEYNLSTGVTSFIDITIAEEQERVMLGKIDNYIVSCERINVERSYVKNLIGKKIYLKDAINNHKITLKDINKKALDTYEDNGSKVLVFDEYEIFIGENLLIIRPLSK